MHLASDRRHLLETVLPAAGVTDPEVCAAMAAVPRERFVPATLRAEAYRDIALPLAHGQAISQPSLVARMTAALHVRRGDRVLEIGTGSGYQAAILAVMGVEVHSVELVEPLARDARHLLSRLGLDTVHIHVGDGHAGWPPAAPYAGVIATCAAPSIPPALPAQLAEGGRLVIPVEGPLDEHLLVLEKHGPALRELERFPVRFVPMLSP